MLELKKSRLLWMFDGEKKPSEQKVLNETFWWVLQKGAITLIPKKIHTFDAILSKRNGQNVMDVFLRGIGVTQTARKVAHAPEKFLNQKQLEAYFILKKHYDAARLKRAQEFLNDRSEKNILKTCAQINFLSLCQMPRPALDFFLDEIIERTQIFRKCLCPKMIRRKSGRPVVRARRVLRKIIVNVRNNKNRVR